MKFKLICLLLCLSALGYAQEGFVLDKGLKKAVIPFTVINNLIFVPINVNGVELTFLLDTGVDKTILFSLENQDEVRFNSIETIKIRGMGGGEYVEALKSSDNTMVLNGLSDSHHDIYIVLDQQFNFSSHIGIPVNGIIGYEFFKSNVIELDYDKIRMTVYPDQSKIRRKLHRRYTTFPLEFDQQKPYANVEIINGTRKFSAKMLLDTGNSDAVWLFPNQSDQIHVPKRNFDDFLGRAFLGDVHGQRARISQLALGNYVFDQPIAAFPDSVSLAHMKLADNRFGSVGAELFHRFNVVFDYKNATISLRPNKNFDKPFQYNMSGLDFQHAGMEWVKETVMLKTVASESNLYDASGERTTSGFKYKFALKPVYTISQVRPGSAADLAGLKKEDRLISINRSKAFRYTLQEISEMLKSGDGKMIELEVERNNKLVKFKFQLKSLI